MPLPARDRKQMEETEKNLAQFREEQDATKRRAAERHTEEKAQRQEQIKRKQVRGRPYQLTSRSL